MRREVITKTIERVDQITTDQGRVRAVRVEATTVDGKQLIVIFEDDAAREASDHIRSLPSNT
jgi:hypothetical protein